MDAWRRPRRGLGGANLRAAAFAGGATAEAKTSDGAGDGKGRRKKNPFFRADTMQATDRKKARWHKQGNASVDKCFLTHWPLACRRNDNLQARVTAKADKKKAKREKKLLRPGFEGRRSGFIPSPGSGK